MGYPSNHLRKSTCSQNHSKARSFGDSSHCYSREVPALMIVFVTPIVNLSEWRGSDDGRRRAPSSNGQSSLKVNGHAIWRIGQYTF